MAKTLLNIRTQCRTFLDEPSSKAKDWTDTELDMYVNTYYHKLYTAVVNVYEDYYLTTDLFDTTEDQQEYDSTDGVATDVFKIRRVEMNYNVDNSDSVPTRCLPISNIDAVRRDLGYQNSGIGLTSFSNGHYYSYGEGSNFKIGFVPIPDKDGTDAGKIWYVKILSDLSSASDEIEIPYADQYWMLIAKGATADALQQGQQDLPAARRMRDEYLQGKAEMQQELEDRIAEETKTVIDTSGDNLDFSAI